MNATSRRAAIAALLARADAPVTGAALAEQYGVSRQVIVQDIALLRAGGHAILPTANGYLSQHHLRGRPQCVVTSCHEGMERLREELLLIVAHGGEVLDTIVEHPVYGELRGTLMLSTPAQVQAFFENPGWAHAAPLSALTGGLHLHTIQADTRQALHAIRQALAHAGFLFEDA